MRCAAILLAAFLVLLAPRHTAAVPQPLATTALALCRQADHAPAGKKRALLRRGLAEADHAVATDDESPAAHFAAFCNLGKLMRLDGASWRSFTRLHRLRQEVDRTLDLQPDNVDALLGKAALLYYTPRILGGDPATSERLLRTAVSLAPDRLDARLALARLLAARGEVTEARTTASRALERARKNGTADQVAKTRELLEKLEH